MDISIYIHYYIGGSWAFPTFPLVRIKLVKQGPIIWRTPALVNKFTVIYANLKIELPFTHAKGIYNRLALITHLENGLSDYSSALPTLIIIKWIEFY